MIEFDENTVGQLDSSQKKFTDIEKMSAAMDMYFSVTDSVSLQEMLDIDIKSEVESLVGGHNDFSGFNFEALPPLELDEHTDIRWLSTNSNHSTSSFGLGLSADPDEMVNPNTVMPFLSLAQNVASPSPPPKESHLTFSPSILKFTSVKPTKVDSARKDILGRREDKIEERKIHVTTHVATPTTIKTITKSTPLLSFKNAVTTMNTIHRTIPVTQMTVRTLPQSRKQHLNANARTFNEDVRVFPKPAYSYSCLIAMALKNSKTGSLPVSEIYSFMCKHFPYFKTAPTGWKNSVRHNLSLNKCFEKIEKPAINGSQRKGCLWAMNPSKISKMDEEVQKWSRKDPTAIKKAMVNPENLEALERGELKFSSSYDEVDGFGDSCGSADSEEGSDSDVETEFIEVGGNNDEEIEEMVEDEIEVSESVFEEVDVDDEEEYLRVQMALAQKELLEYGKIIKKKKNYD